MNLITVCSLCQKGEAKKGQKEIHSLSDIKNEEHRKILYNKKSRETLHEYPPQEEGITIVCNAYKNFHAKNPPIATNFLREMLSLILKENSFQFNGKDYLKTHGTAMGTKMAVAFAKIFMASIEK